MPAINQPAMINDHGVELTIGFNSTNGDRVAIVQPFCTENTTINDNLRCFDLVTAFQVAALADLTACISSSMYVAFIQGEGMVDGCIPYRVDFAANAQPGSLGGTLTPSNVTGLITYYEDPRDIVAGRRMRTAHTFMPGIPSSELTGDIISSTVYNAYQTYGLFIQNGFPTHAGSGNWYRILSAPFQITANPTPPPAMIRVRPRGTSVPRIASVTQRQYVATQSRRLIPH